MHDRELDQSRPLELASLLVVVVEGKVKWLLEVELVAEAHWLVIVVVLHIYMLFMPAFWLA